VVFDLWIVVASIKPHVFVRGFGFSGVCGLLWCNFFSLLMVFVL
jgi:hypothetical protein